MFVFFPTLEHNGVNGTNHAPDSSEGKGSRQVKGAALTLKQFYALLVKRFHHATRSQKDLLAQVLWLINTSEEWMGGLVNDCVIKSRDLGIITVTSCEKSLIKD